MDQAEKERCIALVTDQRASSYQRRDALGTLLEHLPDVAAPLLEQQFDGGDRFVRRDLVRLAVRHPHRSLAPLLIRALKDGDDMVQSDAARALGQCGATEARQALEAVAEGAAYSLRNAAREALEMLGDAPPDADGSPASPASPATDRTPGASPEQAIQVPVGALEEPTPADEGDRSPPAAAPPPELEDGTPQDPAPAPPKDTPRPSPELPDPAATTAESAPVPEPDEAARTPLPPLPDQAPRLIPERFDWDRARRMETFFGKHLGEARALYEELDRLQRQLPAAERTVDTARETACGAHADQDDDVEHGEQELSELSDALRGLDKERVALAERKTAYESELESFWSRLATLLAPNREEETRALIDQLDVELTALHERIEEGKARLAAAHRQQQERVRALEEADQAATVAVDKESAIAADIGKAEAALARTIREALSDPDITERLEQVQQRDPAPAFFRIAAHALCDAALEWNRSGREVNSTRATVSEASDNASRQLARLGAAIGAGFEVTPHQRKATCKITGSLRVEEERKFLSGYSNANGTAHGSGTGTAVYTVDTLAWQESDLLAEATDGVRDAWSRLGEARLASQSAAVRRARAEQALDDYSDYLRRSLEQDFHEARR